MLSHEVRYSCHESKSKNVSCKTVFVGEPENQENLASFCKVTFIVLVCDYLRVSMFFPSYLTLDSSRQEIVKIDIQNYTQLVVCIHEYTLKHS